MNISKEELESVSSDLASLTHRETASILSGKEPSAKAIHLIGGGKESDNSVRRRFAVFARDRAWERLQSPLCLADDEWGIKDCIDQLDAFIAELDKEVQ